MHKFSKGIKYLKNITSKPDLLNTVRNIPNKWKTHVSRQTEKTGKILTTF